MKNILRVGIFSILITLASATRAESVAGINFPQIIGDFKLQSVIDNEKTSPGLGTSLFYNAAGVNASIFVYDRLQKDIPNHIESSIIKSELSEASRIILQTYSDANILVHPQSLRTYGIPMLQMVFQYTEIKPGTRDTVISHIYMTAKNGKYIKLRTTYSANSQPSSGYRSQNEFIESICEILKTHN